MDFNIPQDLPMDKTDDSQPFIQFLFGQRNVPGVIGSGGFYAKASKWQNILGDRAEKITYEFSQGPEEGYMWPMLHFAPLVTVTLWQADGSLDLFKDWNPGRTSITNVFGLIREISSDPVVFSIKGKERFDGWKQTLAEFDDNIIKPVSKTKGYTIPHYVFWMPVVAGPAFTNSHGNRITPPKLAIDTPMQNKKEILEALFVGAEVINYIKDELWLIAQQWKAEQLAKIVSDNAQEQSLPPEVPYEVNDDQIPF